MKRITELAGRFPKQDVWVVGTGPGLDTVPRELIPLERSIGCNNILATGRNTAYVLMVDPGIWQSQKTMVTGNGSQLIVSDNLYWPLVMGSFDEDRIYTFYFRQSIEPGHGEYGNLHKGMISGYYAAEVAAMMTGPGGRVVLAGQDLGYVGGKEHADGIAGGAGSSADPFYVGLRALCRLRDALLGSVEFVVAGPSALLTCGFSALSLTSQAMPPAISTPPSPILIKPL